MQKITNIGKLYFTKVHKKVYILENTTDTFL